MHSGVTSNGVNYGRNGDFSGDLFLTLPGQAVENDGSGSVRVRVPFKDLADIVAKAVVAERIRVVEASSTTELLGLDLED